MKKSKEFRMWMWNRKSFSVVPVVFALMMGLLGAGSTLAQAAPVIDLNSSQVGGVNYTSAIWVNGETHDFGEVKITYNPYVTGALQKVTVRLGDGNAGTLGDSPDGTDEKIYAGLNSYGAVKIVGNNSHAIDIVPIDPTPNATAPASDYNDALNDLYYDNKSIFDGASPNPASSLSVTPGNRTITFTATDASGSGSATTTVPVDSLNDAPSISPTNNTASFIEQGDKSPDNPPGVGVFPSVTVNEPEEQLITRMSFNLSGNVDNAKRNDADQTNNAVERLFFDSSASGNFSASGGYNGTLTVTTTITNPVSHLSYSDQRTLSYNFSPTTGVMDVSGNAYDSHYQLVIRHLRYDNSAQDPTETDRQVTAQAFDAEKGSFVAVSTVSVRKSDNRVLLFRTALPGFVTGPNDTTTVSFKITDVDDETFNGTPIQDQVVNYNREPASTASSTDPYINIQIAVTHGTISLGTTGDPNSPIANLKFVYGTNNSANMEFYGRQQDINQVLTGLTFKADASYTDNALLTVAADDQDNTGITSPLPHPIFLQNIGPGSGTGAKPYIALDGSHDNEDVDGDLTQSSGYNTIFVFGAGEINVTDPGAFLSDKDDNITGVTVSIADANNDGAAENLNTPTYDPNKVAINYNPVTKVLTLSKQASGTEVDLENVIRLITYNHAPGTTTGTGRTITFVVADAAGNTGSAATTITFDKGGPTLSLDADDSSGAGNGDFKKTYVPGGPAVQITDNDLTLTDPDGIVNSATVKLRSVENTPDELLLVDTSGTNITSSYDATTGTLTLTGTDTDANYRQVLASVRYSNVAQTPTQNPRIFDITVSDKANSDTHTSTLTPDGTTPPSSSFIDLDADDSSGATGSDYRTQWNQSGKTTLADTDAYIDETDNTIQKVTVTIANNTRKDGISEILSATAAGGITANYDPNAGVLTLQGPASEAAFITVLRSVQYQNTAATPNGTSRDFRFDVYGNSNNTITATALTTITTTGGGGVGTGTSSIDLDANDSSGATGNDYQTIWNQAATTVIADTDATVDNDAGTIQSVTVKINSRPDGTAEVLDATVSAPITKSFDPATGILTLTGPATPAQFIPVLRSVTYKNNAATINGTSRSFTFSVIGGTNTATATTIISTTGGGGGTSSIDLDADDSSGATGSDYQATWNQTGTTVIADTDATVGNDSGTIQSIAIQINNRLDGSSEVLDATVSAPITKSFDPGTGILTLTGPATPAQFIPALRSVTYKNNAATINGTIRTFTFSVVGGTNTATATSTISTTGGGGGAGTSVIDLNGSNEAGVDRSNILWDKSQKVTLPDSDALVTNTANSLTKIEVTITDRQDDINEILSATPAGAVTVNYNAPNGKLTLQGPATPAEFQNVLRSVQYQNTAANPTGNSRSIRFEAFGGTQTAIATATISTTTGGGGTGNGTAVLDLNGTDDAGMNYVVTSALNKDVRATDTDAIVDNRDSGGNIKNITKITVTISDREDDLSEVLTAPNADKGDGKSGNPNVVASYNAGAGVLTLTGPATPAEFQYALRSVTYKNNATTPTGTSRTLEFRVYGADNNVMQTTTITTTGGGGNGGNNGNGVSTIDLNGTNDPGFNYIAKLVPQTAIPLTDSDAVVTNTSGQLQKITVTITDRLDDLSEVLTAPNADKGDGKSGNPNVVASYNAGAGVLTLTGPATPAEFQYALRSVTYKNNLETPTGTSRSIEFRVIGGTQDVFATTTLTKAGGTGTGVGGIDITKDTDGDGIPDYKDPDSDGNGIPDDEDIDNPLGGSKGDSDGSYGDPSSRIDLNGNGPGYNFTTKWDKKAPTNLADSDSSIKGADTVQKLTVSIVGGAQDNGESMSATVAGGITSSYANGVLTLQGPATRQAFQTVLRSVKYSNNSTTTVLDDDGKTAKIKPVKPTGTTRQFRFDLYGDVDNVDTVTSSATTTIDMSASENGNNNMFTGTSSVSGNVATIVYRVRNTSGHTMNGITIKGKLSGGRPYAEAADFNASLGTWSAKFVTPDAAKRILMPEFGGKNVVWRIDSLDVGQEAVLTITVPLLKSNMGNKLTEKWTATFPGGISETVDAMLVN